MSSGRETFDLRTEKPVKRQRTKRFYCVVALAVIAAILIFFVGFIIGYFAMKARTSDSPEKDSSGKRQQNKGPTKSEYKKYHEQVVNSLKAESVEAFSR